jgi:hypothetical protein
VSDKSILVVAKVGVNEPQEQSKWSFLTFALLPNSCSAKLLWHSMLGISVIMYTGTYVSRVRPDVNHDREIKSKALEEYYAHHGGAHH